MRIAIIAPPWLPVPPPAYGGTEVVLDGLARGLVDAGHEVLLIGHPDSTCPVPKASDRARRRRVPMGRAVTELEHALGAYELAAGIRRRQRSHDGRSGRRSCRVPTRRSSPPTTTRSARGREAIYRRGVPIGSRSSRSRSRTHRRPTLPVAAVIHHGIDVGDFPAGAGDGGYLAALTRMSPDKGVHRAARLARAAGVPLRIAAKVARTARAASTSTTACGRCSAATSSSSVRSTPPASANCCADAIALLNPTEWAEPFGMTMIESLACGTPVIATRRGAAPEIVEHGVTGFLGESDEELLDGIAQCGRARPRRHAAARPSSASRSRRWRPPT